MKWNVSVNSDGDGHFHPQLNDFWGGNLIATSRIWIINTVRGIFTVGKDPQPDYPVHRNTCENEIS